MEIIEFKERCLKHPDKIIEFIKINHSEFSTSHPFFCCTNCIKEDNFINLNDYQNINYITQSNSNEILSKWPSMKNNLIINKMIDITNGKQSNDYIIEQIMTFFSDLKKQIIESLDIQQKKMIQMAESIPEKMHKTEIVKQYQQISKIEELKKELLNYNSTVQQKENICKELIQQSISNENVQLLESLLDNVTQKIIFDSEYATLKQQSILNSIKYIELLKNNPLKPWIIQQKIDVQLLKTDYGGGDYCLEVSKNNNNQPQVINIIKNCYQHNAISDIILDKNIKYIFRFQIDNLKDGDEVQFGLIRDDKKNTNTADEERFCCNLIQDNNQIIKDNNYGIDKHIQGEQFILSKERQVEMRICQKDKILEMLDFPHYQYKIALADEYISKFINAEDLRVCLTLRCKDNKITWIDAIIVSEFD